MYPLLLAFHSLFRWLVLISLLYAIYRAYRGWFSGKPFSMFDNTVRHTTATIAHVQLILGLWLYFISPVIRYFLNNFKDAVHERQFRFFGMEHSTMMLAAIIIITIGSALAKRNITSEKNLRRLQSGLQSLWLLFLSLSPGDFLPW